MGSSQEVVGAKFSNLAINRTFDGCRTSRNLALKRRRSSNHCCGEPNSCIRTSFLGCSTISLTFLSSVCHLAIELHRPVIRERQSIGAAANPGVVSGLEVASRSIVRILVVLLPSLRAKTVEPSHCRLFKTLFGCRLRTVPE
jgi:hypothetical protein